MKTLILSFLLFATSVVATGKPKADSVFIYTGKYAKVYHAYNTCRGCEIARALLLKFP